VGALMKRFYGRRFCSASPEGRSVLSASLLFFLPLRRISNACKALENSACKGAEFSACESALENARL